MGSCWEKTWAGGGQQASVRCWLLHVRNANDPAPASETHLKEKMLAFAATTTVHVRGTSVGLWFCNYVLSFHICCNAEALPSLSAIFLQYCCNIFATFCCFLFSSSPHVPETIAIFFIATLCGISLCDVAAFLFMHLAGDCSALLLFLCPDLRCWFTNRRWCHLRSQRSADTLAGNQLLPNATLERDARRKGTSNNSLSGFCFFFF